MFFVTRFLLIVHLLLMFPLAADANSGDASQQQITNDLLRSQMNKMHTEEVDSFWRQLQTEYGRYLDEKNQPSFFDLLLSGKEEFGVKKILNAFAQFFFHEILYNGKLLGTIVVLTVFSMILQTLQSSFENQKISKVAYSIVFMVILILAVDSFSVAVETAKQAITRLIEFMVALVPLVLTIMTTMGNIASVSLFHPLIVSMIHIIGTIVYTVVFPLLFLSTILSVVSSISEKYKVNQLSSLLRKISLAVLGGLLTIFLGVLSIQGATAAVTDGITIRTAKFVTGNFVPIIGRTISEAAETVVGASLLLKNTVGLAGVILVVFICAFPALKILSLSFIYNFAAAVMQPLGNSPIIDSLSTIGKTLAYIFAALATVGLMFFLAITIIVASGNIAVMMR